MLLPIGKTGRWKQVEWVRSLTDPSQWLTDFYLQTRRRIKPVHALRHHMTTPSLQQTIYSNQCAWAVTARKKPNPLRSCPCTNTAVWILLSLKEADLQREAIILPRTQECSSVLQRAACTFLPFVYSCWIMREATVAIFQFKQHSLAASNTTMCWKIREIFDLKQH